MPSSVLEVAEFPVEQEFTKNPDIRREDIAKLRDWLRTQPHLPSDLITDLELVLVFHCCRRSSSVSKQLIDLYYTLRTLFTPLFKDRDVDDRAKKAHQVTLLLPLKERAIDGSAFFYGCLLDSDAKNFVFTDVIRSAVMTLDLWQREDGTWPGFMIAIDMNQVTLAHLARLDIQTIQQFLYYLQEALLVNLKAVHFLNAPSFMDKLLMMLKPFMKKALMDMLHVHQVGANTLDQFINPKALPKEAGGEYKDFNILKDEIWAKMLANRQFFLDDNKKRVTESRRPGKPKTISDIFGGVEGSFKKLDID